MPALARSMDGRDLSNVPWEASGPNAPVFIDEFFEYDDALFCMSEDGEFYQVIPNDDPASLGYRLVVDKKGRCPDVLYNGRGITEEFAIEYLSYPCYHTMPYE